jgi:hypothetical protein
MPWQFTEGLSSNLSRAFPVVIVFPYIHERRYAKRMPLVLGGVIAFAIQASFAVWRTASH